MKFSPLVFWALAASTSAFSPTNHAAMRSSVALGMSGKIEVSPISLQTSPGSNTVIKLSIELALPGASQAAPAAADATVVESKSDLSDFAPTLAKIQQAFPGSLKNKELVSKVAFKLRKYGYGPSSLLATSLCADEVNRVLEKDFSEVFRENFGMGGLAGFPFGGVTSFGAMAAHIPDGGSCLIVFGPHVGVDTKGNVGTVERYGRKDGGPSCGSAVAASGWVAQVSSGKLKKAGPPEVPLDAQQYFVSNMLLPYASRLEKAADKMVELPYVAYEAQKNMMTQIVEAGAKGVPGDGKIAVLGGIQLNCPPGMSSYFQPLSFDIYDNTGKKLESIDL